MRHAISFSDVAGRRVGVLGIGVEGRAARDRLVLLDCEVVLVDDRPEATGEVEVLANDAAGRAVLAGCDAVVKSPGVSRYREDVVDLERKVPVLGGVGMWLEEADLDRVVCVTGTKGKSTVTTVMAHLAEGLGVRATVAGNLGVPPFAPGLDLADRLVVVETSSFQATDVAHSPGVVVVTALGEDHVDWHGTVERYHADKLSLTSQPGARRTVAADRAPLRDHADQLGGDVTWVGATDHELAAALGLAGDHGARNAAVARAALCAAGAPGAGQDASVLAAASGYEVLKGRFREIARHGPLRFIDDSLATNPLPTLAALAAVGDAPLALLLGGHDRGVEYGPLVAALRERAARTLVVTLPENGPRLGARVAGGGADVRDAADVDEAVRVAVTWLDGDGVVLLSPAAPSFSQFRDWEERSDAFARAVRAVAGVTQE